MSPFASRLGTNYCPSDAEFTQIQDILVEPCLQLQHLDDEIAIVRKALDKLIAERDVLGTYVEAHKALLSPIRRLPRDTIEEIFMACLPTHRNCVMSATEAPVLLGRICSAWRVISLSAPRLWSRLHIVEPAQLSELPASLRRAKAAQRLAAGASWLERSGNCPLSISLEGDIGYPNFIAEQEQFLNLFIPHASRWQDICLSIPSEVLEKLSHLSEDDVPLLEGLKLALIRQYNGGLTWTPSGVFHALNLSRFSISGSIITASNLPLRWNQLKSLDLMGPPLGAGHPQTCDIVLDALSDCLNLRTCKLVVFGSPDKPPRDVTLELLFLHTLDLTCIASPVLTSGQLLSRLLLPALRDFKLDGLDYPDDPASSADLLISFLAASTCLETLSICSSPFPKSSLTSLLRALPPTLCRLDFIESRERYPLPRIVLDDDVLAALELRPDCSTVCPALLELVISPFNEVSDEALLRVIISRMPTLRRVDVAFNRAMEVDILPRLESFLESGAQISIAYPTVPPGYFSPWIGLPDRPSLGS
ncbi:hypothetical protein C8R45DRAFT_93552 [Mycena sanguinolenta]|nr:hypothetical protein C8R45DRAFT_93552 [Mycena sanguinolenta]